MRRASISLLVTLVTVLVVVPATGAQAASTVYVDDDWAGSEPGSDPDGPGPATSFGTDAFATIQDGVNAVETGGTVIVRPGTYTERVTVDKTISLEGAMAGTDARTRVPLDRSTESIVNSPQGGFSLQADGITLDGFTVEDATESFQGAGIIVQGTTSGQSIVNNVVQNNIFGLYLNGDGANPTLVRHNLFADNNQPGASSGNGIYSDQGLQNAEISANEFMNHGSAAVVLAGSPGTQSGVTVTSNQVEVSQTIVFFNVTDSSVTGNTLLDGDEGSGILMGGGDSNIDITDNTIRRYRSPTPAEFRLTAIRVSNFFGAENDSITATGNKVTANDFGIRIASGSLSGPSGAFVAHRNIIRDNGVGVDNDDADTVVNVRRNWWGSSSGPSEWSTGAGDTVSDNADFFPWSSDNDFSTFAKCTHVATQETTRGSGGNDIICGLSDDEVVNGRAGNDLILGADGDDTLRGGPGNDAIIGDDNAQSGNDVLAGNNDSDSLQGRFGTDDCRSGENLSGCES